jgi:hypothetical protein
MFPLIGLFAVYKSLNSGIMSQAIESERHFYYRGNLHEAWNSWFTKRREKHAF